MFSLETEGLRDFTDCRDLKAVICVHMTTRAFQHIPAQKKFRKKSKKGLKTLKKR